MSQTSEDAFVVRHICSVAAGKMHLALRLCAAARAILNKLLDRYNWGFPPMVITGLYTTLRYVQR